MIFFCEDCGKKNTLEEKQVAGGIAAFRCTSCNYLNSYPVPLKKGTPIDHQSRLPSETEHGAAGIATAALDEINMFPHVIGSFLYHYDNGIPVNSMPDLLGEKELITIGEILAKNYYAGRAGYPDISEATLVFNKRVVIARNVTGKLFIAVISDTFPMPQEFTELLDRAVERLSGISKF